MDSFFKLSSLVEKSKVFIGYVGMLRLIRKGAPKKLKEVEERRADIFGILNQSHGWSWITEEMSPWYPYFILMKQGKWQHKGNWKKWTLYQPLYGALDWKDQLLQSYLIEGKKTYKLNMNTFRKLPKICALNSLFTCRRNRVDGGTSSRSWNYSWEEGAWKTFVWQHYAMLDMRTFLGKDSTYWKESQATEEMYCCKQNERKETLFWYPDYEARLHWRMLQNILHGAQLVIYTECPRCFVPYFRSILGVPHRTTLK